MILAFLGIVSIGFVGATLFYVAVWVILQSEKRKEREEGTMNNIRNLREERNMSRAELCRLSGVPLRTVQSWELNDRVPRDVYQLKRVADALNVKIEELIDWENPLE